MKTALITGISGQDGSYLAEYLLEQGYRVVGIARTGGEFYEWLQPIAGRVELLYGDMRDAVSLETAFRKAMPDELYNFAGQVFVPESWTRPAQTVDVNSGGLARLLQIVEKVKPDTRVYQASTSEMFGHADGACDESTPFAPDSPYACSKVAAHWLGLTYRARGIFVSCGILFNHESPRRGYEMVTRKIARAAAMWAAGINYKLSIGNVRSRRDWGYAKEYVRAAHAMLQRPTPATYVVGTGETHTVSEFIAAACLAAGLDDIPKGLIHVDERLVREHDILSMTAKPHLAAKDLNWQPQTRFRELVGLMVEAETERLRRSSAQAATV